ncbi:hypothetical protein F2Q69_00016021 [Brassica cretica]|uniref:pyridoxal kinase n=1 Tax=Brassica cretica TaxID=69181 RepID=A0A8S9R753_BRACR|nr:hypothetical protein F2Q69_00016021 [Brassica cretica]
MVSELWLILGGSLMITEQTDCTMKEAKKYPDSLDKAAELAVSTLQALLRRTLGDYKRAGYDPTSSSLEIRLIQSQDDIRNPNVELKAERYS